MTHLLRFDHIGVTVADIERATEFDGYGLVGGVGVYEDVVRMAYVRGPEGIVVSLSDRVG